MFVYFQAPTIQPAVPELSLLMDENEQFTVPNPHQHPSHAFKVPEVRHKLKKKKKSSKKEDPTRGPLKPVNRQCASLPVSPDLVMVGQYGPARSQSDPAVSHPQGPHTQYMQNGYGPHPQPGMLPTQTGVLPQQYPGVAHMPQQHAIPQPYQHPAGYMPTHSMGGGQAYTTQPYYTSPPGTYGPYPPGPVQNQPWHGTPAQPPPIRHVMRSTAEPHQITSYNPAGYNQSNMQIRTTGSHPMSQSRPIQSGQTYSAQSPQYHISPQGYNAQPPQPQVTGSSAGQVGHYLGVPAQNHQTSPQTNSMTTPPMDSNVLPNQTPTNSLQNQKGPSQSAPSSSQPNILTSVESSPTVGTQNLISTSPSSLNSSGTVPPEVYTLLQQQDTQLKMLREQLAQLMARQSTGMHNTEKDSAQVQPSKQSRTTATQMSNVSSPVKKQAEHADTCSIAVNTSTWWPMERDTDRHDLNSTVGSSRSEPFDMNSSGSDYHNQQQACDFSLSHSSIPPRAYQHAAVLHNSVSKSSSPRTAGIPKPAVGLGSVEPSPIQKSSEHGFTMSNETLASFGEFQLTQIHDRTEESIISNMVVDMPDYGPISPDK